MQFDHLKVSAFTQRYEAACGKRLADRRQVLSLRQSQLAEMAQVSQALISYAEAGARTPSLGVQLKICAALACDHAEIWPAPDRMLFTREAVAA